MKFYLLKKSLTKLQKWDPHLKFCYTDSKVSTPVSCRYNNCATLD